MREKPKKLVRLIIAAGIASGVLVAFSIPLAPGIPAIGNLLNPYGGIWSIDHHDPVQMSVVIPSLNGEVTVIKDEYGIPHIYGDYENDVITVIGYLHARERLVQLEMTRRQISGLISEFYGADTLPLDKFFRNIRLRWGGEQLAEYLKTNDSGLYHKIEAYVNGINYYIDNVQFLPFEFHLLGISPTKWDIGDVLALEKYMSYDLSFGSSKIDRTIINETYGATFPNILDELYPCVTPFQKPQCPNYGSYPDERDIQPYGTGDPLVNNLKQISDWMSEAQSMVPVPLFQGSGSNAWALTPNKSAYNASILCNDPHLSWMMPSLWYEAHFVAEDTGLNCQGSTIVGAPVFVLGHNEHVAWGLTTPVADQLDWYFYEANATHYDYDGTWERFSETTEYIPVKDQAPVEFKIKETKHGIVLNDGLGGISYTKPIAFRWFALTNHTRTYNALYGFMHAQNLTAFNESLKDWAIPSQNVMYANATNIGLITAGWIPTRAGITNTSYSDILQVLNGSAREHEWNGFIPFEELPRCEDPTQGYLATSNQLLAGPEYSHYIQSGMANGYRARRINDLLNDTSKQNFTIDDMKAFQLDCYDKSMEWLIPLVLDVFTNPSVFPDNQKTLLINQSIAELQAWNSSADKYKMLSNLAAPTIGRVILDKFREITFDELTGIPLPDVVILENLSLNDPYSPWFDVKDAFFYIENRDDVIKASIFAAMNYLSGTDEFSGLPPAQWKWGIAHKIYFEHVTTLEALSGGPYPANGSGFTLNPSGANLFDVADHGASIRNIFDFSRVNNNFDTSLSVIPGGSSGDPVSPHYKDQLDDLFLQGKYHQLYYYPSTASFPAGYIEARWYFNKEGPSI
ncbi:MAG: penicillin acylase family protein [Candidatus Hodarchaeota archaeon]